MPIKARLVYPVTVLTIFVIATGGLFVKLARPLLPPDPANDLAYESDPFLSQGGHQQIQWKKFSQSALADAKRRGKPILLVVGTAWSALGRLADRDTFSDPDVEAFLARNMTCLRIDLANNPQWRSAFYPLSKSRKMTDPNFQLVFLDPNGTPFRNGGSIGYGPPMNANELLALLQSALTEWADSKGNATPNEQKEQEDMLEGSMRSSLPDFGLQTAACTQLIRESQGGYAFSGYAMAYPHPLRYLLMIGDTPNFNRVANAVVTSNLIDWMDGGFFYQSELAGRKVTRFDKTTVLNADMMEVFAESSQFHSNPMIREVTNRTFWYLVNDASQDGFPAAARLGDEDYVLRSRRSSISVRKLRETLGFTEDLSFARDSMGLRVETNPMMTVRLSNSRALDGDRRDFERVLAKLMSNQPEKPELTGLKYSMVGANVVARLLHTSVLLNEPEMKEAAIRLFENAEQFRAGDDVVHQLSTAEVVDSYLGDYLAVADLYLQHFLLTGETASLEAGTGVLKRAEFLFSTEVPGIWRPGLVRSRSLGVQISDLPEVLDSSRESLTGQAIRLCTNYSRLLRDPNNRGNHETALKWAQTADSMVRQFADQSEQLAFSGSGYFNASLSMIREVFAISVGPNALEESHELTRQFPFLLCSPASLTVRPSLLKKQNGIYLIQGSAISGPFTSKQASAMARQLFGF